MTSAGVAGSHLIPGSVGHKSPVAAIQKFLPAGTLIGVYRYRCHWFWMVRASSYRVKCKAYIDSCYSIKASAPYWQVLLFHPRCFGATNFGEHLNGPVERAYVNPQILFGCCSHGRGIRKLLKLFDHCEYPKQLCVQVNQLFGRV
jgi:hypothetical protein